MKRLLVFFLSSVLMVACTGNDEPKSQGLGNEGTSKPSQKEGVYFKNLQDGARVQSPFQVKFGVNGKTVEPAGKIKEGTGHHHIIIDGSFMKKGEVVPSDKTHKHYGDGSSQAKLTLPKGKHTLTLQFADGAHKSFGKKWSKSITVNVQ